MANAQLNLLGSHSESSHSVQNWSDFFGLVASIGCAIHCAAMPFLFAFLPSWGLSWLADESFHKWMFAACFVIALIAFIPGFRRHQSVVPVSIGIVGLSLIGVAAFFPGTCTCVACQDCSNGICKIEEHEEKTGSLIQVSAERSSSVTATEEVEQTSESSVQNEKNLWSWIAPWITPVGGLFLIVAHLINHQLAPRCKCCNHQH